MTKTKNGHFSFVFCFGFFSFGLLIIGLKNYVFVVIIANWTDRSRLNRKIHFFS